MVTLTVQGGTVNVGGISYRKSQSFDLEESAFTAGVKHALACGQLKANGPVNTPLTPIEVPKSRENIVEDLKAQEEIPEPVVPEPEEEEPTVIRPRAGKGNKKR